MTDTVKINDEVDALIPMLGDAIDGYQSCEDPLK